MFVQTGFKSKLLLDGSRPCSLHSLIAQIRYQLVNRTSHGWFDIKFSIRAPQPCSSADVIGDQGLDQLNFSPLSQTRSLKQFCFRLCSSLQRWIPLTNCFSAIRTNFLDINYLINLLRYCLIAQTFRFSVMKVRFFSFKMMTPRRRRSKKFTTYQWFVFRTSYEKFLIL